MAARFLSTQEAAEALGLSDRRVRKLCEQGRVVGAVKVGKTWVIETEGEAEVTPGSPGRPRKS